jgi:hypothetical protein
MSYDPRGTLSFHKKGKLTFELYTQVNTSLRSDNLMRYLKQVGTFASLGALMLGLAACSGEKKAEEGATTAPTATEAPAGGAAAGDAAMKAGDAAKEAGDAAKEAGT